MKSEMNPKLKVGDKIILYYMEGELSVSPGDVGVVTKVTIDPFEGEDAYIYGVDWENGSVLNLVSKVDKWKKVKTSTLSEQFGNNDPFWLTEYEDVLDNFDWRFFREFLTKIRNSGIINMFGSAPLLYSGRNHIDRYYGENQEDNDAFQEVLEDAEKAKMKLVSGVVKYMENNNMNLDDIGRVNSLANRFSKKLLDLYIRFGPLEQN